MIETRLLRNALILDEHQNFARAAKALNISQPTLSRSIQLLEKIVGERLFDRAARSVLPTQAGEIILKHARTILSSSKAMEEEIGRHQGIMEGSLRIGFAPYPASALLGPALNRFCERYPNIQINIDVDDGRKFPSRLLKKDYDLAIIETSQLDTRQDFDITPLDHHPGFFFCRPDHPLCKNSRLSHHDLSKYRLITIMPPPRLSALLQSLFHPPIEAGSQAENSKHVFCNNLAVIHDMVANSHSLGMGTWGTLDSGLKAGRFNVLPLRFPALKTLYDIVRRKGTSLSPASSAFTEILIEIDKEQSVLETPLINSLGHAIVVSNNDENR